MHTTATHPLTAWQGWQIRLPSRWNPLKLEGDYAKGEILFADMDRPRLGMRWRTVAAKRFDVRRAMRDEVGVLAADEASPQALVDQLWTASLLYLEPDPPGRDVWVGHSAVSGRAIEIVHHVRRRERLLPDVILPTLTDSAENQAVPW